MYLVDYHTHTRCSPDSEARLSDMVRAAQQAGARELCTTDHCDLQQADGTPLGEWDWGPILEQFEEAEFFQYREDFRLQMGLEPVSYTHLDVYKRQGRRDHPRPDRLVRAGGRGGDLPHGLEPLV